MAEESTLTFLFTDVEGSTQLAQQYPAEMPSLLTQHHHILHQSIEAHRGVVFQVIGDAFCAVFHTATDALHAGLHAQRHLRDASWRPTALKVRMGIHTGPAPVEVLEKLSGGYSGYLTLARTQRVMSAAHGGQILVSGTSAELLQRELSGDIELRDLGAYQLKGLVKPEHLWQVVVPDLIAEFPPIHSPNSRPNNLPIQLTTFIGRQAELIESLRLLFESRLLTLTGPGGTGKTRLAIQTAVEALDRSDFPDGTWLVELAPISSPDLILPTIAAVLNVRESHGRPLQTALTDFLRSRNLLLILDNCEHLIEACALAAGTLLQAGRGVKVLASSREPLGIAGEAIFRLPSFTLPAPGSTMEELLQNEAVQLFVERARAVKPSFTLTPQNAVEVAQICRRLDGIPLAIELAAARVGLFSPASIASRLDDRFRLLTGGSRSAMPRQQTLEALIDWSYELLSPEERLLFQALSVFTGGFTYEAAEAVFPGDLLDPLAQLVNKSLVLAEESNFGGETRYRMLETIRHYANVKLLADGEMEAVRDRHLEYYAKFSKEVEGLLQTNRLSWTQKLDNELDNLRAAIEWALERRPETALKMVGSQADFWSNYGRASEGLRWLEEGIDKIPRMPVEAGAKPASLNHALARAYFGKAIMLSNLGDLPGLVSDLEESIRLWREIGDLRELAFPLALLGFWGSFLGFPNAYLASAGEGLALGRKHGNAEAVGTALSALGREKLLSSDFETAQAYFEEGAKEMNLAGNRYLYSLALISLGFIAQFQGNFQTARSKFSESLAGFTEYGDVHFATVARSGLADTSRLEKDYPQAVNLYLETIAVWQVVGNQGAIARCLECLAFIAAEQAQTEEVERDFLFEQSGMLLGAAEALRESSGSQMTHDERIEYDQKVSLFKSLAPQNVFEAGRSQGREMNIDQAKAIGEALLDFVKY